MSCLALVLALPLQARAADTYKIGLMCPMTGKWASEGLDMKNIVDLQVKKANEQGGINGKKIEVVVEDINFCGNKQNAGGTGQPAGGSASYLPNVDGDDYSEITGDDGEVPF